MSIKKFLCILISFGFIFVIRAATAENENTRIAFTLMEEDDAICLTTSMLPDQKTTVFQSEKGDAGDVFALIRPEFLPGMIVCFRDAVLDLNKERASVLNGSYAGDLFEHAATKEEVELTSEEMNDLMITF